MSPPSHDSSQRGRRVLVVMRHGKAESFAPEDHRRELTERGRRDAGEAGAWLAAQGLVPTHAFVSSATRARASWAAVAEASGTTAEPLVEDAVFTASPDTALDLLRTTPADAEVVLYVGHNPTAASLVYLLDDGDPDPESFRSMSAGFPPAAVAVLEVAVPWAELGAATGHLVAFHVGAA